ncbi:hypothetical protein Hanom_Chr01g00020051 [Helianthus anomalus]
MSLVDEPDEDILAASVEKEQEVPMVEDIEINEDVFTTNPDFVENVVQTVTPEIQKEKLVDDIEGDNVDKDTTSSSSSSEDEVVDEFERQRRLEEEIANERMLRKRKRKKATSRKITTPKIKLSRQPQKIVKKKPSKVQTQKPPTPPRELTPPREPTPQPEPTPPHSPIHQSPPRLPTPPNQPLPTPQPTPPPQQPFMYSQDVFNTPPLSQLQHGSSSRGLQTPQDNLLDVGDFDFANNSQVLKLEKKMEGVIAENKKLIAENKKATEREKLLVKRVEELEKKSEADQSEIDILKVRVSELEEEKNRRDAQNEYFELKHKELNEAKRAKDHELYMLHKVVESMLGSSVQEKFEELLVEEVRAERQAEIDRQMKDKGKGIEGSSAAPILDLVPSMVVENPQPISAISSLFEEPTSMQELIGDSTYEDDDEEEEGNEEDEKDDFVFSASSHSSKGNDDDDAAGGSGIKVTEASNEKVVDDLMNDTVNEESDEATGKGGSDKTQIVEHHEPLFMNLDAYKESLKDVNPESPFDFEEDLESFDINKQEVEDCSDNEDVPR